MLSSVTAVHRLSLTLRALLRVRLLGGGVSLPGAARAWGPRARSCLEAAGRGWLGPAGIVLILVYAAALSVASPRWPAAWRRAPARPPPSAARPRGGAPRGAAPRRSPVGGRQRGRGRRVRRSGAHRGRPRRPGRAGRRLARARRALPRRRRLRGARSP